MVNRQNLQFLYFTFWQSCKPLYMFYAQTGILHFLSYGQQSGSAPFLTSFLYAFCQAFLHALSHTLLQALSHTLLQALSHALLQALSHTLL